MQTKVDGIVEATIVDEDSEGIAKITVEAEVDYDSDGSLSYANKEVKGVIDLSDDDIEPGTVNLTNYI